MKIANDILVAIAIVCVLAVAVLKIRMAWQDRRRNRPKAITLDIAAANVREGQRIAAIPGETVRPRRGQWPTVLRASSLENGEGGRPTVYIESSEKPGWVWCLNPNDTVSVIVE